MAFDINSGKIVLFGGGQPGGQGGDFPGDLHDTWTWDGTAWEEAHQASGPGAPSSGRRTPLSTAGSSARLVYYDLNQKTLLLYSIQDTTSATYVSRPYPVSIWSWNGVIWVNQVSWSWNGFAWDKHVSGSEANAGQLLYYGVPFPDSVYDQMTRTIVLLDDGHGVSRAGGAYDSVRKVIVAFGGAEIYGHALSDTWIWDGRWTQATSAVIPPARRDPAMAFYEPTGVTIMFGGDRC
jgi:hypothetical protein